MKIHLHVGVRRQLLFPFGGNRNYRLFRSLGGMRLRIPLVPFCAILRFPGVV